MIKAKLTFTGNDVTRPKEDIELVTLPDKTHDFVTQDGLTWSVLSITWVQESISPSVWCLCIKLKKT